MAKSDRDWFPKLAPKGFRIRMMEPGEADALHAILKAAGARLAALDLPEPALAAAPRDVFVHWLLRHEVFVAETKAGAPVGFAAARDVAELYWLAGLFVSPDHARAGLGRALLSAVVKRAGWFFHRAVGLSAFRCVPFQAEFFETSGFLAVPRKDFPAILEDRFLEEKPAGVREEDWVVMVKWL